MIPVTIERLGTGKLVAKTLTGHYVRYNGMIGEATTDPTTARYGEHEYQEFKQWLSSHNFVVDE